jgi:type II secretory pathway pseudopilin PulG
VHANVNPRSISIHAGRSAIRRRAGFTLLESLMAAGILLTVVVAVTTAVTAGQQQAYEAQQRIAAGLAAEELMSRLMAKPYNDLATWHGHTQAVGTMTNMAGQPMPATFDGIGRNVSVTTSLQTIAGLDVRVRGRTVIVRSFDLTGRVLSELSRFVPEPQG